MAESVGFLPTALSITPFMTTSPPILYPRLLLTGAAGGLGRVLRPRLKAHCQTLRVSDISELGTAAAGEEVMPVPLQDAQAVDKLLEGVDGVVHLGGVSVERPFDEILPANIVGIYNLYEAARKHGTRRIVFASSNHVTGFYKQSETVTPTMPVRPDGYYGLSKAFGENIARFYFDRYGIETVCLRIGSSYPEPKDRRMLATWLSYDDLERLVVASLSSPVVGFSVIYGMSDNPVVWWDNASAKHVGFQPQDSSAKFKTATESKQLTLDLTDPAVIYQGGGFVKNSPI
jgi:uronate dehydrogenase